MAAADEIKFDKYGGLKAVKGKASGFFRIEKIGDRFLFVTPDGHGFWSMGINFISNADGGGIDDEGLGYINYSKEKYTSAPNWGVQTARKMKRWGINTIGMFGSSYLDPNGMHHRKATEPKLPIVYHKRYGYYGIRDYAVPNMLTGIDGYRAGGTFPDVFSPRFEKWADIYAKRSKVTGGIEAERASPWILGYVVAEELRGLGSKTRHTHLGWAASGAPVKYPVKQAWRDLLREKYKTLDKLNKIHGTRYKSWESDGKSGVLDGKADGHFIKGSSNPAIKADQDEMLYRIAERFFKITTEATKRYFPNHLILGANMSTWDDVPRDEILLAAKDYVDLFGISVNGDHKYIYELTGKPTLVYTWWITAEPDSPLHSIKCKEIYIKGSCAGSQEERGELYKKKIRKLLNMRASDGTYMVVGALWWKYADNSHMWWQQQRNFGFVTLKDNAYDGIEATKAKSIDPQGYPVGGESRDYGNFIGGVMEAADEVNRTILDEAAAAEGDR